MKTDHVGVLNNKQEIYYVKKSAVKQQEVSKGKNTEKMYEDDMNVYQPSEKGLAALKMAEQNEEIAQTEEKDSAKKDQLKAMKIARNIMQGKIVPQKDEQYLMEFDSKLYQVAKAMAALEEQTEKVKSELEEEDVSQELLDQLVQQAEAEGTSYMEGEIANECDMQE